MNRTKAMNATKAIALAGMSLTALVIGAAPAHAQQATAASNTTEEVRVVAPRITVKDERLPHGRRHVTMSYAVSYADLDLTKTADAKELQTRVREAANDICKDLDELFPLGEPSHDVCVRESTRKALVGAQQAIDEAVAQR